MATKAGSTSSRRDGQAVLGGPLTEPSVSAYGDARRAELGATLGGETTNVSPRRTPVTMAGAGTAVPMTAVEPPVIERWNLEELRRWRSAWEAYAAKVNAQVEMGYAVRLAPFKACLSADARDYVAVFVFRKPYADISDKEMAKKVDNLLEQSAATIDPDALASDLTREWARSSGEYSKAPSRVAGMFTKMFQILRDRGISFDAASKWAKFLGGELVGALQPAVFKRRIETLRRTRGDFPTEDLLALHDLLVAEAEEFERYSVWSGQAPRTLSGNYGWERRRPGRGKKVSRRRLMQQVESGNLWESFPVSKSGVLQVHVSHVESKAIEWRIVRS